MKTAKIKAIAWYDANAKEVARNYERIPAHALHKWMLDILPESSASVLDVGAGSGRDAVWLAQQGYDVVAVEPSQGMRKEAISLHPDAQVRWVTDSLPALQKLNNAGLSFDVIMLNAVWMHVPHAERTRAFRKLINLLKSAGLLVISLRQGAVDAKRGMHAVTLEEIQDLCKAHGAYIERSSKAEDRLGRKGIKWTTIAIRLPDDGTGALPLLRHVVLNDDKTSTYKLGLLRCLCRIAENASGFADEYGENNVSLPLGLVALFWIRLYRPLLKAGLPQSRINIGYEKLLFAKEGFKALQQQSNNDLRIGISLPCDVARVLHRTLKDVALTIKRKPVLYMTYNDGKQILPVINSKSALRPTGRLLLDKAYFSSFGQLIVPRHLWQSVRRFNVWIEPAIVAEWSLLIRRYARMQNRKIDEAQMTAAMVWDEQSRDVSIARRRALELAEQKQLHCIWSGKLLTGKSLDIDHCFPWAAWPCNDLWNLLPTHRTVNQHSKRELLPTDQIMDSAKLRIISWWNEAYLNEESVLSERFWIETSASLPSVDVHSSWGSLVEVFEAMRMQRMKLKNDQQIPEWNGKGRKKDLCATP